MITAFATSFRSNDNFASASTTHSELNEAELIDQGIKQNTIRLSIGTENIDDIIEDLDEAFKAIQE